MYLSDEDYGTGFVQGCIYAVVASAIFWIILGMILFRDCIWN